MIAVLYGYRFCICSSCFGAPAVLKPSHDAHSYANYLTISEQLFPYLFSPTSDVSASLRAINPMRYWFEQMYIQRDNNI